MENGEEDEDKKFGLCFFVAPLGEVIGNVIVNHRNSETISVTRI